MAEVLEFALDRFGQLVLALMYYTMDGTMPDDLPPDLKMMFGIYQRKVDAAREKYKNKCAINAQNGSKGGRPRKGPAVTEPEEEVTPPHEAEPPKKAKAVPKVKMPPSEEQFTKLIKEEQAEGLIAEECDPAEFFEWAERLKWKVNGEPAKNVGDFLTYAAARYAPEEVKQKIPTEQRFLLHNVYGRIFKEFHGLRDDEGNTQALTAAINFLSACDSGWDIHGKTFTPESLLEALNEFMKDL